MTGPISEVKPKGEDVILGNRNKQMIVFCGSLFHGFAGRFLFSERIVLWARPTFSSHLQFEVGTDWR